MAVQSGSHDLRHAKNLNAPSKRPIEARRKSKDWRSTCTSVGDLGLRKHGDAAMGDKWRFKSQQMGIYLWQRW
jgi:hypothetical protein